MKYERIKRDPIEAEFFKDRDALFAKGVPPWVGQSLRLIDLVTHTCTESGGLAELVFPSWIIREASGKGAYPCTDAYFQMTFREASGGE